MKVLIVAGLGPSIKNTEQLDGTFLQEDVARSGMFHPGLGKWLSTDSFHYIQTGTPKPLLRPRSDTMPNLTMGALATIVADSGWDCETFPLVEIWRGSTPPLGRFDLVALSTTFLCNMSSLKTAIKWTREYYPEATLVLGGQFSNLKYKTIIDSIPDVDMIVRGDGELGFPSLLDALDGRQALDNVPNLVCRDPISGNMICNEFSYVNLDDCQAPRFSNEQEVIPYESMRGCPFTCKFCSFPFASPEWRFKSAERIVADWRGYQEVNGTKLIKAMDSTFTVPPSRLASLFKALPEIGIGWEAYSRANAIKSEDTLLSLEESGCRLLSIGFESMSDRSLKFMHKQVRARHNRRAHDLLVGSKVGFRASFMVGYPGERLEDYEETHRFITKEMSSRYMISVFSLLDETMPVWQDAGRFGLRVADPDDPDSAWSHKGMDSIQAKALHRRTLQEARWRNDRGVLLLWQMKYEMPLIPEASDLQNQQVEKCIERLAFGPRDLANEKDELLKVSLAAMNSLRALGVVTTEEDIDRCY